MLFLYCYDLFLQTVVAWQKRSYSLSRDNDWELVEHPPAWADLFCHQMHLCNLQTKCKTVKFIQARNTNLPLSDQDSQQFIILMYALPQRKNLLTGLSFTLIWHVEQSNTTRTSPVAVTATVNLMNSNTENNLLKMTRRSITYSMTRERRVKLLLRHSCRTKWRSQGHILILSLFSLAFFVVYELLTLLFSMFAILISKGFVSSQHWKSTVRLEISTSCILFVVLKIIV